MSANNRKLDCWIKLRRVDVGRRFVVRYGDTLGRRSGLERRRTVQVFKRFNDSLKVILRGNF